MIYTFVILFVHLLVMIKKYSKMHVTCIRINLKSILSCGLGSSDV
jgi:hypothetical protein